MDRNRVEDIASFIVVAFLGLVLVYALRSGEPLGALPFLLGVAIREFKKRRRDAS